MKLYKYRADGPYTEKGLQEKTVWLAKPADLNDPFECTIIGTEKSELLELEEKSKELRFAAFVLNLKQSLDEGEPFFHLSLTNLRNLLDRLNHLESLDTGISIMNAVLAEIGYKPSIGPAALLQGLEERLQATGIYSLSERNDDPKMWAQYADNHKGLCLEFDASGSCVLANLEKCHKVKYVDEMPAANPETMITKLRMKIGQSAPEIGDLNFSLKSGPMVDAICTKGRDWASEVEWRYVEPTSGSRPFPARLTSIIFGYKMPAPRRAVYRAIISEKFWYAVGFKEVRRREGTTRFEVCDLQQI